MIWLGSKRGFLTDWVTQQWVHHTGRRIDLSKAAWLNGPVASTVGIGSDYFATLAATEGLDLQKPSDNAGIVPDFATLKGASFEPARVHPDIIQFYEHTSAFELDAWAEWCGLFRPFGWLLAVLFSRRLQQLNVPLSSLDTSRGMSNEVLQLVDPTTGIRQHTAWFRRLRATDNIIYAGIYSVCNLPGRSDPCVKVVFPLPNGNAIVIMRTECRTDGSFVVTSAGGGFGEPGFYFTVHDGSSAVRARYVQSLRESIHVFAAENGVIRADHVLTYFRMTFLRIHYRMRRQLKNP
jgi:hypothetical protein